MAWDRMFLKDWIKDRNGIPRSKEDGLLTDTIINDAIEDAIKQIADDCRVMPTEKSFPLREGQWSYPMPDDLLRLRQVYFKDSDGTWYPCDYYSQDQFIANRDLEDDTSEDILYYSYAPFQSKVHHFYSNAPNIYDYLPDGKSYVTSKTIRTIVDSGINFGKTLDGVRVKPGDIGHNLTDGSYGYVYVLDTITNKIASSTATSGTNTRTLEDTGQNFTTSNVAVGDIVCLLNASGFVISYAFVKTVGTTTLTYEDFQDPDANKKSFASADTYKIGTAQKILLSIETPHPGLREGATNDFTVGDAKATITGTTFTATTVIGSSTTGAEANDIAIASGGSHGKVTTVAANQLTVDMWIGGQPADAETVTVKECDQYQVEGEFRTQRVMRVGPTPSQSDTIGSESMMVLYYACPKLPTVDSDPIEMDERYKDPVLAALEWKAAERIGAKHNEVNVLRDYYKLVSSEYRGDIDRPPLSQPLSAWNNRKLASRRGVKDQTASGRRWSLPV